MSQCTALKRTAHDVGVSCCVRHRVCKCSTTPHTPITWTHIPVLFLVNVDRDNHATTSSCAFCCLWDLSGQPPLSFRPGLEPYWKQQLVDIGMHAQKSKLIHQVNLFILRNLRMWNSSWSNSRKVKVITSVKFISWGEIAQKGNMCGQKVEKRK